jgi:preprotein translocase subunit SecA
MRLFAGDAVKRIMQWAGLTEGEPIVSSMVTRRIEGAQKKREEQHFDQRKNLLEYDEVMDEQRKRTYSYRQRILDGVDCRNLLLGMMYDEIERWTAQFLAKDYRWETIVGWVTQNLNLEIEPSDIRDMARPELEQFLRDEGERQGETLIYEQIDVDLPEDTESKLDWNWLSLSKWANRHFGLSLQDKDLRKYDREAPGHLHCLQMAKEGMARRDYAPLDDFLDPQFPQKSLAGWSNFNFLLGIKPEELLDKEQSDIVDLLQERVRVRYDEKEVTFPVSVGMHNFLAGDGKENERFNREKLARWANTRFRTAFIPEQFSELQSAQINETLVAASKQFLSRRPDPEKVEARLNEILGPDSIETNLVSDQQIQELLQWADTEHGLTLNDANLRKLNASQVRIELLQGLEQVFRPEMRQTERSVLLEFLDTAWKDHLYFMGHLKQGIGFVGYAQKDPRTEYKREGRRAFLAMWDRIAEQVTQAVFRIEHESPAFVGSLWRISATEHDVAAPLPVDNKVDSMQTNAPEAGEEGKTIAPIVNDSPRIGRNDDCPCGSGKKYKKCCGK